MMTSNEKKDQTYQFLLRNHIFNTEKSGETMHGCSSALVVVTYSINNSEKILPSVLVLAYTERDSLK